MKNHNPILIYLRGSAKVITYLFLVLVALLLATYFYINSKAGKVFIANKVETFLSKKLKTKFFIGEVDFHLPNEFKLSNIYLESFNHDSLLYAGEINASIALFKLINNETEIKNLELKNAIVHISRNENDSNYNYQFILDAFANKQTSPIKNKDTTGLKLNLRRLLLTNVKMNFNDQFAGDSMYASVDYLELKLKAFKPDKLNFDINSLDVNGVSLKRVVTKHVEIEKQSISPTKFLMLEGRNLKLKNIQVNINDHVNDFHYSNDIDFLSINKAMISLANNKLEIDKIILQHSSFEITTKSSLKSDSLKSQSTSRSWLVKVKQLEFAQNSFKMKNGEPLIQGFDKNNINAREISLLSNDIYYSIDSTHAYVKNLHLIDHSGLVIDTFHANIIYSSHQIAATELYIKTPRSILQHSFQLSFDSLKSINLHPEKTIVKINLKNSVIAFDDLFEIMPSLRKNVSLANMRHEKLSINTEINGSLRVLNIEQLNVVTLNGSILNAKVQLKNVIDAKKIIFDIRFLPTQLSKNDFSKFITLDKQSYSKLPAVFFLEGDVKGKLNDFITNIKLKGNQFFLDAKALLINLSDPKKIKYDVDIHSSHFQKELMMAFIPQDKIPQKIEFPNIMLFSGSAKGDMNNVNTNLTVGGSYGKISAKGYLTNFQQPNQVAYNIDLTTDQFLIGKLLKQDTMLDAVTMNAIIIGRGYDINSMVSDITMRIDQLGAKQYNYQDINISANLNHGALQSIGSVNDPNVQVRYMLNSNNITNPTDLALLMHLDTIRLHELHLTKDTIELSSTINLQADNLRMDNLNATLKIDSVIMTMNRKQVNLDSILVVAQKENEEEHFTILSPIVALDAKGRFEYDKLMPAMMNYINRYYHLSTFDTQTVNSQQIQFKGKLNEHPLIKIFIPQLTHYDSILFAGSFNSSIQDSGLNISMLAPHSIYGNYKIGNSALNINSNQEQLKLVFLVDSFHSPQASLLNTQLNAIVSHDSLDFDIVTKNKNGKDRYALGARISVSDNSYTAHLKEKLILNNQSWRVQPTNTLFYSPSGFYISDFNLGANQSLLTIQSEQAIAQSPINIEIKNFSIRDITTVLNQDSNLASGIINGKFKLSEFDMTLPAFEGDVMIDTLFVKEHKVGNLALITNKVDNSTIHANVKLSDNENDIQLDGNYFLNNSEKQIDADLKIVKFNIASIEGFSDEYIGNAKGYIDGNLNVKGKFSEPIWNGKLHFADPSFRLVKFGTAYKITNQTLVLNYPIIELNQFAISDSANHKMILDGKIISKSISNYSLDLNMNSKDFIVVNTQRSTNDYIYGFAGINSDLNIQGSLKRPIISGDLSLNDATDATVILPQQSENKDKAKSVVRFIDRDTFDLPEAVLFSPLDTNENNINTSLNYNVNIDLSKKASLTMIIDPSTGDELKVSGEAKLNVGVDAGGNIVLVGNYDLAKGHYILHYQFLQRQFDLLPQSTILFSGNPMDAQLDIRAEYIANTSAIDLVGNELGDADSKTVNTFNQKIPFKVLLFIKGTMNKLDISFDIKLPEENVGLSNTIVTTVENKLTQLRADPSAINKQVFSLLVLNRFVGEQSSDFFKGNGGGIEDIARESVSKFLSAALDQIASDIVKGVDIDLNLNSYKDYRSGETQQRTDLNVGITKRFMNDRLSISLGKDFGVEGEDKNGKTRGTTNASYLPNATVNYKLSKDGKYAVRVYSKNKFEVILDGYVVESGLSFLVTMDYEKFSELFGKKLQVN